MMNKTIQLTLLSIFGGTLGISLLTKYYWNSQIKKARIGKRFDELLSDRSVVKCENIADQRETIEQEHVEAAVVENEENKSFVSEPLNDDFPLRLGSHGPRVKRLQIWLLRNFGWTGKPNGILDQKTQQQMIKRLNTQQLDRQTYQRLQLDAPVQQQKTIR